MNPRRSHGQPGLPAKTLLDLWDHGRRLGLAARALEILGTADPELPSDELRRLPVSQRDARLLAVRACTLGPKITAVGACPECGETAEITFRAEDVGLEPATAGVDTATTTLRLSGRDVVLRAVTAGDLCDADALPTPAEVRELLLQRAVISVDGARDPNLDEGLAARIEGALERLDPQAVTELTLKCPACEHRWSTSFDAMRFFWEEIKTAAARLLAEVAELARAFHWSESEILAMSDARRRHYLEIVRACQVS